MPGRPVLAERVAIRPSMYGTLISQSLLCSASLIEATSVRPAGAGSDSHMASIAASFDCCDAVTA